jgi:hypothetical protein
MAAGCPWGSRTGKPLQIAVDRRKDTKVGGQDRGGE